MPVRLRLRLCEPLKYHLSRSFLSVGVDARSVVMSSVMGRDAVMVFPAMKVALLKSKPSLIIHMIPEVRLTRFLLVFRVA